MKQHKISEFVLATGNSGKVKEFSNLFESYNISIYPQSEFNVTEADETGLSFIENAILKARNASEQTQKAAIADDSGLEVFSLNGQPGIFSARYAGANASDQDNLDLLLSNMQSVNEMQRGARFYCALAMVRHPEDPTPVIAEGSWYGEIALNATGTNGFGYDPIFHLPDLNCSAADLGKDQKSKISHRAQALQLLVAKLHNQKII